MNWLFISRVSSPQNLYFVINVQFHFIATTTIFVLFHFKIVSCVYLRSLLLLFHGNWKRTLFLGYRVQYIY